MKNPTEQIDAVIENQNSHSEVITKKIPFKKETLRNLVTMASREYFDTKAKQDEILAAMLDKIVNRYYQQWKTEIV